LFFLPQILTDATDLLECFYWVDFFFLPQILTDATDLLECFYWVDFFLPQILTDATDLLECFYRVVFWVSIFEKNKRILSMLVGKIRLIFVSFINGKLRGVYIFLNFIFAIALY
jgi:hypothetical protein